MQNYLRFSGTAAAAIVFAASAPSAVAQENTTKYYTCQNFGTDQPEPLGDREGHSISVNLASCTSDSGPQAGGVLTGTTILEWDGPNAVMLSSSGIVRKPGATLVYKNTEGKIALTMTDGKVTSWTVSGRGTNVLATGSWAAQAGKWYNWTGKPVGPGSQYSIESKDE